MKAGLLACPQPQPAGPVSLRDPGAPLFLTPWASRDFVSALASGSQLVFLLSLKLPLFSKPLENLLLLKTAYRISTDSRSFFSCGPLRQVRTPDLRVFTLTRRK